VRLDAPDRLFVILVAAGLLLCGYAVCGVAVGVLVPVVVRGASQAGWGALLDGRLLPAALLLALVGVALARAGRVLVRQMLASRRLARQIRRLALAPLPRLDRAACTAGLVGRVGLIASPAPVAFVHGMIRPRVVISDALLVRLSSAELLAVLQHERYHLENLDPLKIAVIAMLTEAAKLVSDLSPFQARHAAGRELAADRRAIAVCGRRALAGALLKAVPASDWAGGEAAIPLRGRCVLASRVAQLETGVAPPQAASADARALLVAASGVVLLALLAAAIMRVSGASELTAWRLVGATLFDGLSCAALFAAGGVLPFTLLALLARRAPNLRTWPGWS
jgi:Zn-dependent protease with chaperone function